jgi:glycosyltransferase involved in cell wall biosynthesis
LGQTFTDFEFVILDFGSTDRSQAIAATYAARDNRIRLHQPLPPGAPFRRLPSSCAAKLSSRSVDTGQRLLRLRTTIYGSESRSTSVAPISRKSWSSIEFTRSRCR